MSSFRWFRMGLHLLSAVVVVVVVVEHDQKNSTSKHVNMRNHFYSSSLTTTYLSYTYMYRSSFSLLVPTPRNSFCSGVVCAGFVLF